MTELSNFSFTWCCTKYFIYISVFITPNTSMGFPGGSDGKESTCIVGHLALIPGLGRSPAGGHGNSFQYSCLENPNGQRSLVGYSPWGRKELDMTEWLSTAQHSTWMFLSASNPKSHQCLLTLDYVKSLRKNTAIHINTTPTCNNTVKSPKCQV